MIPYVPNDGNAAQARKQGYRQTAANRIRMHDIDSLFPHDPGDLPAFRGHAQQVADQYERIAGHARAVSRHPDMLKPRGPRPIGKLTGRAKQEGLRFAKVGRHR